MLLPLLPQLIRQMLLPLLPQLIRLPLLLLLQNHQQQLTMPHLPLRRQRKQNIHLTKQLLPLLPVLPLLLLLPRKMIHCLQKMLLLQRLLLHR
jgi:hypothetical protein